MAPAGGVHQVRCCGLTSWWDYAKFLALDKCLPSRQFLQVVDFPEAKGDLQFTYDEEWLAITLASDRHYPLTRRPVSSGLPDLINAELQRHREWVRQGLMERGNAVPIEFSMTALPCDPSHATRRTGDVIGELLFRFNHNHF